MFINRKMESNTFYLFKFSTLNLYNLLKNVFSEFFSQYLYECLVFRDVKNKKQRYKL